MIRIKPCAHHPTPASRGVHAAPVATGIAALQSMLAVTRSAALLRLVRRASVSVAPLATPRSSGPAPSPRLRACMATSAPAGAGALVFDAYGEPENVLQLRDLPQASSPGEGEVSVRFLLAPINPSDVNTIQGKYPIKPSLPGVPGHEGVAQVTALGDKVSGLSVGDWVVPLEPCVGTWRQGGSFPAASFHRIPSDIPPEAAAMLCINPPSALAMLETFVELQEGDVVVQNGANSAVGKLVIQLARAKGVRTVNIIRDRPNWAETVAELKGLGADVVTTEERAKEDMKAAGLAPGPLGLNCVGGSSAVTVAKLLRDGGTLVTYGGMSMQPVSVPTALLIFKDISFKGFWLSGRLAREQGPTGRAQALDRLVHFIQQGKLNTGPVRKFPLSSFQEAFHFYNQDRRGAKVLLDMS